MHVLPGVLARHGRDARVGDDDVQPTAELVDTRLQDVLERRAIPDVGLLGDDAGTGVLDELDRGGQIVGSGHRVGHRRDLVAEVHRDDVGAFGRQLHRVRAALTAGRASDEGDLALQGTHVRAPVSPAAGPWRDRPRRRAATS